MGFNSGFKGLILLLRCFVPVTYFEYAYKVVETSLISLYFQIFYNTSLLQILLFVLINSCLCYEIQILNFKHSVSFIR